MALRKDEVNSGNCPICAEKDDGKAEAYSGKLRQPNPSTKLNTNPPVPENSPTPASPQTTKDDAIMYVTTQLFAILCPPNYPPQVWIVGANEHEEEKGKNRFLATTNTRLYFYRLTPSLYLWLKSRIRQLEAAYWRAVDQEKLEGQSDPQQKQRADAINDQLQQAAKRWPGINQWALTHFAAEQLAAAQPQAPPPPEKVPVDWSWTADDDDDDDVRKHAAAGYVAVAIPNQNAPAAPAQTPTASAHSHALQTLVTPTPVSKPFEQKKKKSTRAEKAKRNGNRQANGGLF